MPYCTLVEFEWNQSFGRERFTAIMGPSGSGKPTLMHCLAGLDRPTGGQGFLGGLDLGPLTDTQLTVLRRERVGFIFRSFNLLPAPPPLLWG